MRTINSRWKCFSVSLCLGLVALSDVLRAQSIRLNKEDAVVWHLNQRICGTLEGASANFVNVHHNDTAVSVPVTNSMFCFDVVLDDGANNIWVAQHSGGTSVTSDTLQLSLGYSPGPLVKPFATVDGDSITLRLNVIENPRGVPLKFLWTGDAANPMPVELTAHESEKPTARIPEAEGKYFFDLLVIAGSDSLRFRTYVTRHADRIIPFDIAHSRPSWIGKAIIYQITPHAFTADGNFASITAKLPELKTLGINTIYLQPVYKTFRGGQGYDIIDYFSLRPDLGTEAELRTLISSAKALGLRVLFDFVPNHTSIHHPYAESIKKNGAASPYYDYYQHDFDGVTYSSHYNKDGHGFIYYFWEDLVNLNYDNEEVQRWMIEACKYWVREFDIDGYRFDAVWGVNARRPSFGARLRRELKNIKPEVFLLAEDKPAADPLNNGFDAAYDWTMDTSWVSQCSWAYAYDERESHTVYNYPDASQRASMLREGIFPNGAFDQPLLRFMENNDLPRFGVHHSPEQVRMAAALLMSLPGIPMLYNGQEVGVQAHPYTRHSVFKTGASIRSMQPDLFDYYRKLIGLRQQYSAMTEGLIRDLPVSPSGSVFAFYRQHDEYRFIIVSNLDSLEKEVTINVDGIARPGRASGLRDVLTGENIRAKNVAGGLRLRLEGYSTRWLLLM